MDVKRYIVVIAVIAICFIGCEMPHPGQSEEGAAAASFDEIGLISDVLSGNDGLHVKWYEEGASSSLMRIGCRSLIADVAFDDYTGKGINAAAIRNGSIRIEFTLIASGSTARLGDFTISTVEELEISKDDGAVADMAIFTGKGNASGTEVVLEKMAGGKLSGVSVKGNISIRVEISITIDNDSEGSGPKLLEADVSVPDDLTVKEGDSFDSTVCTVNLYYDDGSQLQLKGDDSLLVPYNEKISPNQPFKVLVRYEGQSVVSEIDYSQNVEPELTPFVVSGRIEQVGDFLAGQRFDSSAFVVYAILNNGEQIMLDEESVRLVDAGDSPGDLSDGVVNPGDGVYALAGKGYSGEDIYAYLDIAVDYIDQIHVSGPETFSYPEGPSKDVLRVSVVYDGKTIVLRDDEYTIGPVEYLDGAEPSYGNPVSASVVITPLVGQKASGAAVSQTFIFTSVDDTILPKFPIGGYIIQTGDFLVGQAFDPSLFSVIVQYSDGSTAAVDSSAVSLVETGENQNGTVEPGDKASAFIGYDYNGNSIMAEVSLTAYMIVKLDVAGDNKSFLYPASPAKEDLMVTASYYSADGSIRKMVLSESEYDISSPSYENGIGPGYESTEEKAFVTITPLVGQTAGNTVSSIYEYTSYVDSLNFIVSGYITQTGDFTEGQAFDPSMFAVTVTYSDGMTIEPSDVPIFLVDEGTDPGSPSDGVVNSGDMVYAVLGKDFNGNEISVTAEIKVV